MSTAIVILLAVIFGLLGLLLWGVHACIRDHQSDHAKCIAHIASVTSNRIVAQAIREMAERYDSIEGGADLNRIRNTTLASQRTSQIPAIWMREQADRIESGQ